MGFLASDLGELLEQVALLAVELGWRLDRDPNVLISPAAAMQPGDALSLQPEHLAALRPRGNPHLHLAVESGHLDLCPQRRLSKGDGHLAEHLAVLADEDRMLLHVNDDVQVARRTAVVPGFAFAGEPHPRAGVHPAGNLYF